MHQGMAQAVVSQRMQPSSMQPVPIFLSPFGCYVLRATVSDINPVATTLQNKVAKGDLSERSIFVLAFSVMTSGLCRVLLLG